MVNHPPHYTAHPSGVECIEIIESLGFLVGNAIKYLWRYQLKHGLEDLQKARWYAVREYDRRKQDQRPIGFYTLTSTEAFDQWHEFSDPVDSTLAIYCLYKSVGLVEHGHDVIEQALIVIDRLIKMEKTR